MTLELFHGAEGAAGEAALKVRAKLLRRTERKVTADLFSAALSATNVTIAEASRSMGCAETFARKIVAAEQGLHVERLVRLPRRAALAYLDALRAHIEGSAPRPTMPLDRRALRASVKVNEAGALVLAARAPSSPGGCAIVDEERGPILRAVQRAGEELRAIEADVRGER